MKNKNLIKVLTGALIISSLVVPNKAYAVTTAIDSTSIKNITNTLTETIKNALEEITNSIKKYTTTYKELPTMYDVEKNKEFTITFSKEINNKTINGNNVKVINSKGEEIAVTVGTKASNNKVGIILPPMGGYTEGETYALIVRQGITDLKNLKLAEEIVMKFTVKNTTTQEPPQEGNKTENEIFIDNLYKTNSTYWNQGAKYTDGKLNLYYYDYGTKQYSWKTLSTSFNSDINKQTIDVFKSLYTEKEGYKTEIDYFKGLTGNGGALASISLYINNSTIRGNAFIGMSLPDERASSYEGEIFSLRIADCTKENYIAYKNTVKSAINSVLDSTIVEQVYSYIDEEYVKIVLDDYYGVRKYNANKSIYESKKEVDLYKNVGNIKVHISSSGTGIGVSFLKP